MNKSILLFSTNCPKCKALEMKLKQLGLDFTVCTDLDTVLATGKQVNIQSAPILQVDNTYYDFSAALSYLKTVNNSKEN